MNEREFYISQIQEAKTHVQEVADGALVLDLAWRKKFKKALQIGALLIVGSFLAGVALGGKPPRISPIVSSCPLVYASDYYDAKEELKFKDKIIEMLTLKLQKAYQPKNVIVKSSVKAKIASCSMTGWPAIKAKIRKVALENGISDEQTNYVIAQAALETGYGKHVKGNNLFNIKGKGQKFRTHEFYKGKKVYVTDSFRRYESLEESIKDYFVFLKNRFPIAYIQLKEGTGQQFLAGLDKGLYGKYATDPRYKQKIHNIVQREVV